MYLHLHLHLTFSKVFAFKYILMYLTPFFASTVIIQETFIFCMYNQYINVYFWGMGHVIAENIWFWKKIRSPDLLMTSLNWHWAGISQYFPSSHIIWSVGLLCRWALTSTRLRYFLPRYLGTPAPPPPWKYPSIGSTPTGVNDWSIEIFY